MSYLAAGDTATTVLMQAKDAIELGRGVAQDPHLGELVCNVKRLKRAMAKEPPGAPCPPTKATPEQVARGIGLQYAVYPIKAFTVHRQQPWALTTGVTAVLLLAGAIGYQMGKGARR